MVPTCNEAVMAWTALGQVNDLDLVVRMTPISEPLRNDYTIQQALLCTRARVCLDSLTQARLNLAQRNC